MVPQVGTGSEACLSSNSVERQSSCLEKLLRAMEPLVEKPLQRRGADLGPESAIEGAHTDTGADRKQLSAVDKYHRCIDLDQRVAPGEFGRALPVSSSTTVQLTCTVPPTPCCGFGEDPFTL